MFSREKGFHSDDGSRIFQGEEGVFTRMCLDLNTARVEVCDKEDGEPVFWLVVEGDDRSLVRELWDVGQRLFTLGARGELNLGSVFNPEIQKLIKEAAGTDAKTCIEALTSLARQPNLS